MLKLLLLNDFCPSCFCARQGGFELVSKDSSKIDSIQFLWAFKQ